jgi:hypothetical protein
MIISEGDNRELYDRVQEQNLVRQYDFLTNCIELGLIQGHTAFDPGRRIVPERIRDDRQGYVDRLRAADRAWHEGNLDFSALEAYLARLLEAQLRDAD